MKRDSKNKDAGRRMLAEMPSEWARGWDWMVERWERQTDRREDNYYLQRRRSSWGDENISPFIALSVATLLKPWTQLENTAAETLTTFPQPHSVLEGKNYPLTSGLGALLGSRTTGSNDPSLSSCSESWVQNTWLRGYRVVHWPPERLIQWIIKCVLEDRVHTMMAITPVLLYGLRSASRYLIQLI